MDIVICKTAEKAEALTAHLIAERVRAKPDIVLGLATGRTMECVYTELLGHALSFAGATSFNLDEYIGISRDDPRSYWQYMQSHLFSYIDIDPKNIHLPHGDAEDLKAAARDYEEKIKSVGGIDLQLLGIGRTGHIGFNEPLSSLTSRTRDKTLTRTTRVQNASMFGGDPDAVPTRALTMGVGTILEAREIILLATGEEKAEILAKAMEGPLTSLISASAVQIHPACKVIADEGAASKLQHIEHYKQAARFDPDWHKYQHFLSKD